MSTAPMQELALPYEPAEVAERVERRRRMMRSRLISLVITVVVLVGFYLWRGEEMRGPGLIALYAVLLAVSVAWWVFFVVAYRQARAELAAVGDGIALRVNRSGVELAGLGVGWAQVAGLAVVPRKLGRTPLLQLTTTDNRTAVVPLEQLPVFPATLDSTVRAFSAGRHGVDLSALDN